MPAPQGYTTRTLKDFVAHDFGASDPIVVDQERINAFANITGDHQWIHVDVEKSRKMSPFGGPVAHGFLKIVDRKKDMVIVSGFNVYPNEVEAVVTACHGVAECACIGVPDPKTGEAVRVYVVKTPSSDVTAEQIIAHCRKDLAAYKIPKQIHFIDALPKSNVGKILRRELRKMALG